MKLHRAAALTLIGWYLLVPQLPPQQSGKDAIPPDVKAPLYKWDKRMVFDTRAECLTGKAEMLDGAKQMLDAVGKKIKALPRDDPRPLSQTHRKIYDDDVQATLSAALAYYAQCVETDDPRLKQ
jgi:hypothetical protein